MQVRVHMRFIRVHRFTAVPARGATGYRTPLGLPAKQAWTPVPAPKYPPRESNPHAPKDTAPSTRPVYLFRQVGLYVLSVGVEPTRLWGAAP